MNIPKLINYTDTVSLQRAQKLTDDFDNILYDPPISIKTRKLGIVSTEVIKPDSSYTKIQEQYFCPIESGINANDKIDERVVASVFEIKDVFGNIVYLNVRCDIK